MSLLSKGNNHVFICGITRSGKTYFAKKAVEQLPFPAIFFNIQEEQLPAKFLKVDETIDADILFKHLKAGGKVNFTFTQNCDLVDIMNIIAFIIKRLMAAGFSERKPIYVIIDEAQLLKDVGKAAAIDASTRGLAKGVRLICISQRPALVDKTIYTQAFEQYLFRLSTAEAAYLKNKGIDYEKCKSLWDENGEHSYCYFNGIDLIGYKAI